MTHASKQTPGDEPGEQAPQVPDITPPAGSLENLFRSRPLRFEDVVIETADGVKRYRVRELKKVEQEKLEFAQIHQEPQPGTASPVVTYDTRGNRALAIAMALIHDNGAPMISDPEKQWPLINELPAPEVDKLYAVVDRLSLLTPAAKQTAGKASGGTSTVGG